MDAMTGLGTTQESNMSGMQATAEAAGSRAGAGAGAGAGTGAGAAAGTGGAAGAGAGAAPSTARPLDPAVAAGLPRAGFWARMGALSIDVLLVSVVLEVLRNPHGLSLILLAVYGAVMWKVRGTTVGGIVFDQQVVREDGRPLDWETAAIRALACFLSLFVAGLGFLWIAFGPSRQAWHDKIAGTIVVRVPEGTAAAPPRL